MQLSLLQENPGQFDQILNLTTPAILKQKTGSLQIYKYTILILLILWLPGESSGKGDFYIDKEVRTAYQLAFELRLERAEAEVGRIRKSKPDNLFAIYLENYIDFLSAFTSEEEAALRILQERLGKRIELTSGGNKKSPYNLFLQAEMLLHSALVKMKFDQYYGAMNDIRRANELLKKNRKAFPDFMENDKSLAVIQGVVSTVPDNYRSLVGALTGLKGTIPQSMSTIRGLVEALKKRPTSLFYRESLIIYAMMSLHLENDREKAWRIIDQAALDTKNGLLAVYAKAHVARSSGRTVEAIKILEGRPKGKEYIAFYLPELMLGINKLNSLDPKAIMHLLHFVKNHKGRNYIKEAYQKLAWYSIAIKDDPVEARVYYKACLVRGFSESEEDQAAQEEAKSGIIQNKYLLRARLLLDGGFYSGSLLLLRQFEGAMKKADPLQTEYLYARNHQMLDNTDESLRFYRRILTKWPQSKEYQVCNAALQSGLIWEKRGDADKAASFFRQCLRLKPVKYQSGLHQKAKAGLNRLNK